MELSPLLMFWLLLASVVVVTAVAYFRPRLGQRSVVWETAVGLMALVWLLWFLLGRQLPLTSSPSSSPLILVWQLDTLSWQLSGVWLLLVTAGLVGKWAGGQVASEQVGEYSSLQVGEYASEQVGDSQTRKLANLSLATFLLAAAGLLPLLAGNLAAMLLATTLLIGAWSAVLWLLEPAVRSDVARLLPRAIWLMLSLLFIWLAAAVSHDLTSLTVSGWPPAATLSVLAAAWLLLGGWPFHGWRLFDWQLPAGLMALLVAAPALAGLSLLARLVTGSDAGVGYGLFLTLFGLLGVFMGVRRAWSAGSPLALAVAVALVQANLAGLALFWVGPETAVGEARVLVLAVDLVFLIGHGLTQINADFGFLRRIGLWLALAGVSGLPLLAGFAGRAGLYAVWLANGRFVLVLVVALLQMLLVTAVAASGEFASRQVASGQVTSDKLQVTSDEAKLDSRHLLVAFLLLAGGLISFRGLAGMPLGAWLAVLLPFGGGLALAYFVGEAKELNQIIRRAFVVDLPTNEVKQAAGSLVRRLETAVQDAVTIWEGEGGLLWLLALLIGLLVIGGG